MGLGLYILDNEGNPIPCINVITWGRWLEESKDRIIEQSLVSESPPVMVSTVFLGMDHCRGEGKPILWETMIFGGPHDGDQVRYDSREAALEGHKAMVQKASLDGAVVKLLDRISK